MFARPLILGMLAIVVLTVVAYWPGLQGGFTFDDDPNIVENPHIHLKELSADKLWQASWRGEAGPLRRPLSMATFALNYHFSGLNPFPYKLTNVLIHLLNGRGPYLVRGRVNEERGTFTINMKSLTMNICYFLFYCIQKHCFSINSLR